MPAPMNAVTGATGLLGSHIVEKLTAAGESVRALVRGGSDTSFLQKHGVALIQGDLLDPKTLGPLVAGADVVYHCAARIGNWGSWKDFRSQVVDATGNLFDACSSARVGRVLHVSSVSVYGHPRWSGKKIINEDEPLGQRLGLFDYYCRAKIEAERLARAYDSGWTIVRPSWILGPRDRNSFPRLVQALRDGWVSLVGDGNNLLNVLYAGDVADGAIRAANFPGGKGQVYHLTSQGAITQKQFFDFLTEALGLPGIDGKVSVRLANWSGLLGELIARTFRWKRSPHVTQYGTGLLTRPTCFSTEKARSELDWEPQVSPQEALRLTLEWVVESEKLARP